MHEEIRVRNADGSERWLSLIGQVASEEDALPSPSAQPTRRATRFSGIAADITERKRREASLALLDDIATDFARLSLADEIMQRVSCRLCDHLAASSCYLLDIDESRNEFRADYIWTADGMTTLAETLPVSAFVTEEFRRVARSGETIVVSDTFTDPRTDGDAYAGFDIGAFITVPFARDGAWRLLFAVCDNQRHAW